MAGRLKCNFWITGSLLKCSCGLKKALLLLDVNSAAGSRQGAAHAKKVTWTEPLNRSQKGLNFV